MEHEDNAHLDNYLQNSHHLMDNLQMASGAGVCADVGSLVGSEEIGLGIGNISGKFEEHEEQDDVDELKYIKEEQQSEKQQTVKDVGDDMPQDEVGNSNNQSNGNGNIDAGDELLLLGRHEHETGDGFGNVAVDAFGVVDGFGVGVGGGVGIDDGVIVDEEAEVEIIKKYDGDFSTTSNTTSTPGDDDADVDADAAANAGIFQVEMKIESAETMPHMPAAEMEEEEPSSLATNTTNGTNSLSENLPAHHDEQEYHGQQQQQQDVDMDTENKENTDPLMTQNHAVPAHGMELNFEMHSQLNPDAREFVPSFGSNPSSPTAPVSDSAFGEEHVGEPAFEAVGMARHLLGEAVNDDFVAQSPRKGSGEINMDMDIALPPEIEFEHEAAKRPHELENDDLIGDGVEQLSQQANVDLLATEISPVGGEDTNDFQRHSPSSFIDHGPETSVDHDVDIDEQGSEVMRQTEKAGESIEQLLNTVQPLPIDTESLNASFADEVHYEQEHEQEPESEPVVGEKEHLDVDEKEHISHSPSTEEMQMNFQNELHASAKDIPHIPADLDNAEHMQESIYLEHTSSEAQQQQLHSPIAQSPELQLADESLVMNTSNPLDSDISFEAMRAAPAEIEDASDDVATHAQTALNIFAPEFMPTQKLAADASPSPQSTEEKHLIEETKEDVQNAEFNITGGLDGIVQGMDDMILSAKDEILSQAEDFAQAAANVIENLNPFAVDVDNEPTLTPAAEFILEASEFQPQTTENSETPVAEDKPIIPEPELIACQYNALSEQVAEAVKTAAEPIFDAFAPTSAINTSEPDEPATEVIAEPTLVAEESVIAAAEAPPADVVVPNDVAAPSDVVAPAADDSIEFATEPSAVELAPAAIELAQAAVELAPAADVPEVEKPVEDIEESKAEIAAIAATVAVVAGAAVAAEAAVAKKTDTAKPKPASRTPTSAKPKVGEVKKAPAAASTKKPIAAATATKTSSTTTATAARPRTAPALKPSTNASGEKKTSPTPRPTTTTAARKPLTASASTTKTTTARTTTTTGARPGSGPAATKSAANSKLTTATRTTTTTATARRTAAPSSPSSNGTTAKARPTASAPTKPTSLGLSGSTTGAAKPKVSSPRATLTSQLRKTAPSTGAAKSPLRSTAPTTNGTTKSTTLLSSARTKTSTVSTTTTTTTTKTFTARPAPKTTLTSTTTTRRSGATPATTKTSSTLLKKSPAGKTTTTGRLSSPTKAPTTTLKTKTKEPATKNAPTPIKAPAAIKRKIEEAKTNGNDAAHDEQQPHLNGGGDQPMENGVHNGGEQQEQQQNGSGLEHELQQQAPVELSLMDA